MSIILNSPTCRKCSDYGYAAGTGAPTGVVPSGPGEVISDRGRITLLAGTPHPVLFTQISVLDGTKWVFAGEPICHNSVGVAVNYTISAETGTGFTVTANSDSTFEYVAIKI